MDKKYYLLKGSYMGNYALMIFRQPSSLKVQHHFLIKHNEGFSMKSRHLITRHISENRWQYTLLTIIFVVGALLGESQVSSLDGAVKSHLLSLVDKYIEGGITGNNLAVNMLFAAFINQAYLVLTIWFLGLTVIGLPLILGLIFLRGFSLGFTLGFLVSEKSGGGVLFGLLAIVPQNLVYIPFILIWGVVAMNFSIQVLRARGTGFSDVMRGIISYTLLMLVFLALCLMGAFIETYLSPWLLNLAM